MGVFIAAKDFTLARDLELKTIDTTLERISGELLEFRLGDARSSTKGRTTSCSLSITMTWPRCC